MSAKVCGNPDVIVTDGSASTSALKRTVTTIPVVFVSGDPVGMGLVPHLSRPGGTMTGFGIFATELNVKRLELLRAAFPNLSHVGVLYEPRQLGNMIPPMEAGARSLGLRLTRLEVRRTQDIDRAFAVAVRERVAVVTPLASALFNAERTRLVSLAEKHRRPAMYENRAFPEDGGLMSYGPDLQEVFRRVAVFVDRILKGAKPADLPVEQPTKFELIVDLKTAKALGLTIPQTLLLQSNQVIEQPVLDPRGQLPACCCRLRRILQCCRTTAPCTASARGWIRGLVLGTSRSGCPPRLRPAIDSVRRARLAGNFYTTGMEHSPTSATGTGWKRTPWHATQRAAWEAAFESGKGDRLWV